MKKILKMHRTKNTQWHDSIFLNIGILFRKLNSFSLFSWIYEGWKEVGGWNLVHGVLYIVLTYSILEIKIQASYTLINLSN